MTITPNAAINFTTDFIDFGSGSVSDGSPIDALDLGPGETITVTFENTMLGKIIVEKITDPESDEGFEFDPSWGSNFFLSDGETEDSGELLPGTYTVEEINIPSGWSLTSIVGADSVSGNEATIILDPGETVTGMVSQGESILDAMKFTDVTDITGLNPGKNDGIKSTYVTVGD